MSQTKWLRFKPILQLRVSSPCLGNKACQCPITLVLHDLNPATAHFNLLVPVGQCCTSPAPSNLLQQGKKKSYASVLKQKPGRPVNPIIAASTNVEFVHQTASSSNQPTACNNTANSSLKQPPILSVNSADSPSSTESGPVKGDVKPSTTAANQPKANVKPSKTHQPNNDVKPSSTAKGTPSTTEGKTKTDVNPSSSAKQPKASGTPSTSEGEKKPI